MVLACIYSDLWPVRMGPTLFQWCGKKAPPKVDKCHGMWWDLTSHHQFPCSGALLATRREGRSGVGSIEAGAQWRS